MLENDNKIKLSKFKPQFLYYHSTEIKLLCQAVIKVFKCLLPILTIYHHCKTITAHGIILSTEYTLSGTVSEPAGLRNIKTFVMM